MDEIKIAVQTDDIQNARTKTDCQIEISEANTFSEDNIKGPSKFKNQAELLKAYQNLEKEFTKKSQYIKELELKCQTLEKPVESVKSESLSSVVENSDENIPTFSAESNLPVADIAAESITENTDALFDDFKVKADKFFIENPKAKIFSKQIAQKVIAQPELMRSDNCMTSTLALVMLDLYRSPNEMIADDAFLSEFVFTDKAIEQKIVERYFEKLLKGENPITIGGKGQPTLAPPNRPKSVDEAGWYFLKNN